VRSFPLQTFLPYSLFCEAIYWGDEVEKFIPERFIDTVDYRWPRHACKDSPITPRYFIVFNIPLVNAFSGGARGCIGQRFALTESICILAQIARKYEICIPEGLKGKPFDEQKEIMLAWKPRVTMMPINAEVMLRPRK